MGKRIDGPVAKFKRVLIGALVMGTVVAMPSRGVETDPTADAGLALRIAEVGQATARANVVSDGSFAVAASLFDAAAKLDPTDPRYPMLAANAWLAAREPLDARKALKSYLALRPDDQFAMLEYADLVANAYETADARLAYLRGAVANDAVPKPVRSVLAMRAATICQERTDFASARTLVETALTLNPLNVEALNIFYVKTAPGASSLQRVAMLLATLRANPNNPDVIVLLARELADVGLAADSAKFYMMAINLSGRIGRGQRPNELLALACELYLAGQASASKQIIDQVMPLNYGVSDLAMLRLLAERAGETKDFSDKSKQAAQVTLYNALQMVRKANGDSRATTRPVDSPELVDFGDFTADIRRLQAVPPSATEPAATQRTATSPTTASTISTRPTTGIAVASQPANINAQRQDLADVLEDLAWYQIYYLGKPGDAAPAIAALRQLLGTSHPVVARLEGWAFLVDGHPDEAKVKLSAVSDTDTLAHLGLVKLLAADPTQQARAKAEGESLLQQHARGPDAVTIVDALRDVKAVLTPQPPRTAAISAELAKFPMQWLSILDRPQAFYMLSIEPLKVAHKYREPVMCRVSLQNVSDFPITVGPDGIVHQEIWFDAQFKGLVQQQFSGVAIDRMGGPLVLAPHAMMSQDVRVDQGQLGQVLQSSPFPSLQLVVQARSNPSSVTEVGPAGEVVVNLRSIERVGFNGLNAGVLTAMLTAVPNANGADKLRSIDLMSVLLSVYSQQQNNPQVAAMGNQVADALRVAQHDASPSVSAWAQAVTVFRLPDVDRPTVLRQMTNDPNWQMRLVAMAISEALPPDKRRAFLSETATRETDPLVRRYAALQLAVAPPSTQPSTVPASQPVPARATSVPAVR